MMAVRDDDGPPGELRDDGGDRRLVGDAPEPMVLAFQVVRFGRRRAARIDQRDEGALGIADEHEDEPDVGAGRLEQREAIALRARVRPLVRQDVALAIVGHLAQRHEAHARDRRAADRVRLVIGVDRGPLLALPHAVGDPPIQHELRARVLVPGFVGGFGGPQLWGPHVSGDR